MDFAFTEEQQMIRDTAESFLYDVSNSEAIRRAMTTSTGFEQSIWKKICQELYFQAINIPEEFGGMGLGYVELAAVMGQMGRFLVCAPYFSTVCMANTAVLLTGNKDQQATYFDSIMEGGTASLAYAGEKNNWFGSSVNGVCERHGDGFSLNGDYLYVIDGHTAQQLIVATRSPTGISLFLISSDLLGVERKHIPTLDQTRKLSTISLKNVLVPASALLGNQSASVGEFDNILQLTTICMAAEQQGVAERLLDLTVDYTKERVQFNRLIASFQAVKHKAADMMLKSEVARSSVYYAACIADEFLSGSDLGSELPEASSIAKAWCSEAAWQNAGEALQLHGGVGFTWEYDIHLYFKRAKAGEMMLGNAHQHREIIAQHLLDDEVLA